jgi:pimeloyl-ACP methyl ester carboxylesterase
MVLDRMDMFSKRARCKSVRISSSVRKVKQPALVISSEWDKDNPLRRQQFVAEMIPYAKHEVIEGAGLMPSLEQPKRLSKILRDWYRQPLLLH